MLFFYSPLIEEEVFDHKTKKRQNNIVLAFYIGYFILTYIKL